MSEKLWLSGEWLWKENMFISDKIRKIIIFFQLQKIATRFMSCKKIENLKIILIQRYDGNLHDRLKNVQESGLFI